MRVVLMIRTHEVVHIKALLILLSKYKVGPICAHYIKQAMVTQVCARLRFFLQQCKEVTVIGHGYEATRND